MSKNMATSIYNETILHNENLPPQPTKKKREKKIKKGELMFSGQCYMIFITTL